MSVMTVSGPMSHLLNGVYEQSFIADVMAYSACVGRWELSLIRRNIFENDRKFLTGFQVHRRLRRR